MLLTDAPPTIHFNYDEMDLACRCQLCTGFIEAKTLYEATKDDRAKHHRYCRCDSCVGHKERLLAFLAASNKREIYSEISYALMAAPEPHTLAAACLRWLYEKILDPDYHNTSWWALQADRRLLRSWIEDFQHSWERENMVPASFWAASGLY
jgi:hypothetical protein